MSCQGKINLFPEQRGNINSGNIAKFNEISFKSIKKRQEDINDFF